SSFIDRSAFTDDSELNVESLIENLKNVIMKKLSVLYVTESSVSLLASSVTSFSAASLSVPFSATSQSSTLVSVSGSPALTTSVPATLTPATSALITAFITSSSHFKEMLYRLSELHFSVKDIHVFRNRNTDVILFYTHRYEA
ncbi:hypothetical protein BDBG_17322, partial [Blastomyces gilchristii SLH14081]